MVGVNDGYTIGGDVRFCENNKWGYNMFEVAGEQWAKLRELVEAALDETAETRLALCDYMASLCPTAEQP